MFEYLQQKIGIIFFWYGKGNNLCTQFWNRCGWAWNPSTCAYAIWKLYKVRWESLPMFVLVCVRKGWDLSEQEGTKCWGRTSAAICFCAQADIQSSWSPCHWVGDICSICGLRGGILKLRVTDGGSVAHRPLFPSLGIWINSSQFLQFITYVMRLGIDKVFSMYHATPPPKTIRQKIPQAMSSVNVQYLMLLEYPPWDEWVALFASHYKVLRVCVFNEERKAKVSTVGKTVLTFCPLQRETPTHLLARFSSNIVTSVSRHLQ